jgi:hypothetical protein
MFMLAGCADNESTRVINPNGDSELALLMREMFDDGMRTKQKVLDGQMPAITCDYRGIHTAEATQPEKAASEEFKSFAKAYEVSASEFLMSDPEMMADNYQTMVTACMNCHKAVCPGPMVKIKKMYLSENQLQALSVKDRSGSR